MKTKSNPVQQHYLPKKAYLNFFSSPQRPGYVYFYQRTKEPILTGIGNIAKMRHLYSIIDELGNYDYGIEKELAKLENEVKPLLERLNSEKNLDISGLEISRLSEFVSYQIVRTPGYIEQQRQSYSEMQKSIMISVASNKEEFTKYIESLKEDDSEKFSEIDVVELREYILKGEYNYEFESNSNNKNFFLVNSIDMVPEIFNCLMSKNIIIIKNESAGQFITSDYPALVLAEPKVPFHHRNGYLFADVILPIGPKTLLYFKREEEPAIQLAERELKEVRKYLIRQRKVDPINDAILSNAEDYLFSSELNPRIAEKFKCSEKPQRFSITNFGPYTILSNKTIKDSFELRFERIIKRRIV